jgi:hypothetical protein
MLMLLLLVGLRLSPDAVALATPAGRNVAIRPATSSPDGIHGQRGHEVVA